MSGGVDSSVAALLLKKQGYDIVAAFMKNWSDTKDLHTGECLWREERRMAAKICALLDIPLITLDFEKEYKNIVIKKMFEDYKRGITPNPDVLCNEKVKFPLLWKAAQKIGAEYIVTGHYARIKKEDISASSRGWVGGDKTSSNKNARYQLLRAKDETKDQSYFLYRLTPSDLKHTIFPIGDYTKKEIRSIAEKNKFPNANKKSTVGICFIGKVNLKEFLKQKIKPKKGNILSPENQIIGEHDGIFYYTIGQRIGSRYGIEVQKNESDKQNLSRWYVARKNPKTNTIIAAPENHPLLYRKEITIKEPHWITQVPKIKNVHARIRQVGELLPATLIKIGEQYKVNLKKAITGVSEGQAIVLYQGTKVLGGGTIAFE